MVLFGGLDVTVKPHTSAPQKVTEDGQAFLATPSTIQPANNLTGGQIELALGRKGAMFIVPMPGVGQLTVMALADCVGGVERFPRASSLANY